MDTTCAAELFVCFYFLFIFYESAVVFLMLLLIDCMVFFYAELLYRSPLLS